MHLIVHLIMHPSHQASIEMTLRIRMQASKLLADPHLRPQHMACGLGKKVAVARSSARTSFMSVVVQGRGGWRRYVTRALYMSLSLIHI